MIKRVSVLVLIVFIGLSKTTWGVSLQTDESAADRTSVTLFTLAEPGKVPLNRHLTFIVRMTWEGDLDLIKIVELEEPVLTNFEIVGSSSSNQVSGITGGRRSVKEIAYTLQPKSLGMGYVESTALSYEDITTGKTHHLMTQRVGVEVIQPVPEEGEVDRRWILMAAVLVVLAGGSILFFLSRRRRGPEENEKQDKRIVEEVYLQELKESVDLKGSDRREAFSVLSKLFRRYLSEKYGIATLEATTEELLGTLTREELDEGLIRRCETLLNKADVVKFSGQEATQAELDEAYTTVETMLESHLTQAREALLKETEQSKKRKKWNIRGN